MGNNYSHNRYASIDVLKAICAFFIVCIHAPIYGNIGGYFTSLIRFSVPIFFIITGYNYFKIKEKFNKYVMNILKLTILSNIIYMLYRIVDTILNNESILTYIREVTSFKSILKLVLFNESPFMWHLWYLFALLYVLFIYRYLEKNKLEKKLFFICPLLLIGDLIIGKYSILFFGKPMNHIFLVRNFLFVGLPYFCMGIYMKCREKDIINFNTNNRVIFLAFIVSVIICIIERTILINLGANAPREQYISTTIMSIIIFIFILRNKMFLNGTLLETIGREYSTWIYILHPLVIKIIEYLLKEDFSLIISSYAYPFIIYIITIMIIYMCKKVCDYKKYILSKKLEYERNYIK